MKGLGGLEEDGPKVSPSNHKLISPDWEVPNTFVHDSPIYSTLLIGIPRVLTSSYSSLSRTDICALCYF